LEYSQQSPQIKAILVLYTFRVINKRTFIRGWADWYHPNGLLCLSTLVEKLNHEVFH
jgi:hypothetical protein